MHAQPKVDAGHFDLAALIPQPWRSLLEKTLPLSSLHALGNFLNTEFASGASVLPPVSLIFEALRRTPPARVKVVVLGQDPYPTAGVANGLCFSVTRGTKIPASLKNIFEGLRRDLGIQPPTSGDLSGWADRGLLLLNTVLTVREGTPNSHKNKGWEDVTRALILSVNALPRPVVFFAMGKQAQQMVATCVDATRHAVVATPHPSPLAAGAFLRAVDSDHPFREINRRLEAFGHAPMDWSLEGESASLPGSN